MVKKILHRYQLAEARGHIKEGTAAKATFATILEAGCVAFHEAYYGKKEYNRVRENHRAAVHQAGENAGRLQEALISDVSKMNRALREAQTSSDFPYVLANIRNQVIRGSYNPVESDIFNMSQKRTATDFKLMHGYRVGAFDRLPIRPEGTDVDRTKLSQTKDGYKIANYELAMPYTWEAWVNDDLSVFTIGMANLGIAARRTRALVAYEAIKDGLASTAVGGVGGPDIDRLDAVILLLAEQTNDEDKPMPRSVSDIAFPTKWRSMAATTLNSQQLIGPTDEGRVGNANPVFGAATPHEEPMMAEVLGADWLAWDARAPFLETATLQGFEAGPKTYTKMPDNVEHPEEGSFDSHDFEVKVGDAVGAKVIDDSGVVRVDGAA